MVSGRVKMSKCVKSCYNVYIYTNILFAFIYGDTNTNRIHRQ